MVNRGEEIEVKKSNECNINCLFDEEVYLHKLKADQ